MAGGFMSGFGSAFSRSFEQGLQERREKDRDMFKLKYADYISRRDQIEKEEQLAQKQIKAAKDLVNRTGVPAEMWGEGFKMLQSGYDIKDVEEYFTSNDFIIEPITTAKSDPGAPASPQDDLTNQAQSTVDAQMSESGMAPPADGGIFGNLKAKLGMGADTPTSQPQMSRTDMKRNERVTGDIASAAGVSPEEVNRTLGSRPEPTYGVPEIGFKAIPKGGPEPDKINTLEEAGIEVLRASESGDMARLQFAKDRFKLLQELEADKITKTARAKAIAEGTYAESNALAMIDKDGNFVKIVYPEGPEGQQVDSVTGEPIDPSVASYRKLNKRVLDKKDEITKEIGAARKEYTDKVNNAVEGVRLIGDIRKMVDPSQGGDPRVLTATAGLAQTLQGYAREAYTAIDVLSKDSQTKGVYTEAGFKKMQNLEAQLAQTLGSEINTLAGRRAMYEAKVKLAAYRFAMMEGQSGRDISNADAVRWDEILSSTNDPKVLQEKLASITSGKIASLRSLGSQVIRDNQQVIDFEREFGFNPWGDIKNIDQYLSEDSDPLIKSGLEYINKPSAVDTVVGDDDWSGLPEWAPMTGEVGLTPSAFRKLSPRAQELLKKKYEGAQNASNSR
jgi:hypothetical protein